MTNPEPLHKIYTVAFLSGKNAFKRRAGRDRGVPLTLQAAADEVIE